MCDAIYSQVPFGLKEKWLYRCVKSEVLLLLQFVLTTDDHAIEAMFRIRALFFTWIFSYCRPTTPFGSEAFVSFIDEIPSRKLVRRLGALVPLHNLPFGRCERWIGLFGFPSFTVSTVSSRSLWCRISPFNDSGPLMQMHGFCAVSLSFLLWLYVLVFYVFLLVFVCCLGLGPVYVTGSGHLRVLRFRPSPAC